MNWGSFLVSFRKVFKFNESSFDEQLSKRNLKHMMNVLKPDSNAGIREKVNAAEFLGTVTNLDLKNARIRKPRQFNNIIKPENTFKGDYNPISRLITILDDENEDLRQAAADSLIQLVKRHDAGEKLLFFYPSDLILIGASLGNKNDRRGKEVLIKAIKDKVLSQGIKIDKNQLKALYGWKNDTNYSDLHLFRDNIFYSLSKINDYIILDFYLELNRLKGYFFIYHDLSDLKNPMLLSDSMRRNPTGTLFSQKLKEGWIYPPLLFDSNILMILNDMIREDNVIKIREDKEECLHSITFFSLRSTIKGSGLFTSNFNESPFMRKKMDMISDSGYILIENYVNKYNNNMDTKSFKKLKTLLNNNGIELNTQEILFFILKELDKTNFNIFKSKMLYNNPKTLENYVENIIKLYGNGISNFDNIKYIISLERLLLERNIQYGDLFEKINEKNKEFLKEKELSNFEDELTGKTDFKWLTIKEIDLLDGYEFENFLKRLFKEMGFKVEHTRLSGDQGADLIISKHGEKTAVQSKRYQEKVNNKAIQEVVASIAHYKAHKGMVVTNSEFTQSAIVLGESNNIELINRSDLEKLIKLHPIKKE